ncbi:MAG TPA: hypothetical protein VHU85_06105 [Acidimicrobiales bacterium]|nr:hypothetical protein [Acidimicrobiales bacterium]
MSAGVRSQPADIFQLIHELSPGERAEVLRCLQGPSPDDLPVARPPGASRRWIVRFLALCCLALVPWTIGLAVTLPRSYLVGNWPLAWTGFDLILLSCLSTTAWALWKQRQVAVPAALITSALLLCDAWFDIITAHSGRCLMVSVATAVFGEVPIAILLGFISIRLQRAGVRVARGAERAAALQSLWRTPLITSAEVPMIVGTPSDAAGRSAPASSAPQPAVSRDDRDDDRLGDVIHRRSRSRVAA